MSRWQIDPPDMELLDFLMTYIEEFGRPPVLRIIASRFGLSLRGATMRLARLQDAGYIERQPNDNGAIAILRDRLGTPVKLEFVANYG